MKKILKSISSLLAPYWRPRYAELVALILLGMTPLTWFGNNELILGHDSGMRLDYLHYYKYLFYSWNPSFGYGFDTAINKGFLITQLPELLFVTLAPTTSLGQRLAFSFWTIAIGLSMYVAMSYFYKAKEEWFLRLFGSFFYMVNFFLLQAWVITERAKFSIVAALPLTFVIVYATLTRKISLLKGSILFGLVLFFLNGGGSPPIYGSLVVVNGLLVLTLTAFAVRRKEKAIAIRLIGLLIGFFISWILFNSYWILPQLAVILTDYSTRLNSLKGIQGILDWENVISRFATFDRLLRFQGIPDWYDSIIHAYSREFIFNPGLITASFIPAMSIVTWLKRDRKILLKDKEKSLTAALLLIWVITMLIMAGTLSPLGFIIEFLFRFVPGFSIFRSLFYKFGAGLWFSGAWLSALAFYNLTKSIGKTKIRRLVRVVLLYGLLVFHFPFFVGTFFDYNPPFSTKVSVPEYVYQVADKINESPHPQRVLLLPPHNPEKRTEAYSWGYLSFDLLLHNLSSAQIVSNDLLGTGVVDQVYAGLDEDSTAWWQGLQKLGITHLLVRQDTQLTEYEQDSGGDKIIYQLEALGLTPSYQAGLWSLYTLDSDTDYVSAAAAYGASSSDSLFLLNVVPAVKSDEFIGQEVTAASAVLSTEYAFTSDYFNDLNRKFKPDSPLYLVSVLKNRLIPHKKPVHDPKLVVEYHLRNASKHLFDAVETQNQSKQDRFSQLFLNELDACLSQIKTLTGPEQSEAAQIAQNHLIAFKQYVEQRPLSPDSQLKEMIDSKYLAGVEQLKPDIWFSPHNVEFVTYRYWLETTVPGSYHFRTSSPDQIKTLNINGKALAGSHVLLEPGMHRVELVLTVPIAAAEEVGVVPPKVAAFSTLSGNKSNPPEITGQMISPTLYNVQVTNASEEPYLLTFFQSPHPNWELVGAPAKSVEVDGFAQGWIVQKPGTYSLKIKYKTQDLFYVGLFISSTSLVAGMVTLWYISRKHS